MSFKTPQQTTAAAVTVGADKAAQPLNRTLVGGFLAGAYIAFGGLVMISVSSGLDPKTWGTLPALIAGSVFALGLILVVVAGSDLLTGNMALVPTALFRRRVKIGRVSVNFALLFVANLLGALFVAYFLAVKSGVIGSHGADPASTSGLTFARLSAIAKQKTITESDYQIFLRGMGCNWLVCLAVWLAIAAEDVAGKILGIFFPIMAFVAMGFDHVVANMFFLPAAMFAHVPGISWGGVVNNWLWAFLGNLAGAVIFVATCYWYLHLRGQPDLAPAGATPHPRPSPERLPTPAPPTTGATSP